MRVLNLFSGIGSFSLGLERAGMETVAFCENDPFCQKVLKNTGLMSSLNIPECEKTLWDRITDGCKG